MLYPQEDKEMRTLHYACSACDHKVVHSLAPFQMSDFSCVWIWLSILETLRFAWEIEGELPGFWEQYIRLNV
jgi:hypothetical protein